MLQILTLLQITKTHTDRMPGQQEATQQIPDHRDSVHPAPVPVTRTAVPVQVPAPHLTAVTRNQVRRTVICPKPEHLYAAFRQPSQTPPDAQNPIPILPLSYVTQSSVRTLSLLNVLSLPERKPVYERAKCFFFAPRKSAAANECRVSHVRSVWTVYATDLFHSVAINNLLCLV